MGLASEGLGLGFGVRSPHLAGGLGITTPMTFHKRSVSLS